MIIKYYIICCPKNKLSIDYLNKFAKSDIQNFSSYEEAKYYFNRMMQTINNEDYGLFIFINNKYWVRLVPRTKNYIIYNFLEPHYFVAHNIDTIIEQAKEKYSII